VGIIDTLKDVATLVQKADNIELTNKVIALQTEVLGVFEENRTLRDRVSAAESALELKAKMQFDKDVYWMGDGRTEKDGPYCSRCFDIDGKPVRMVSRYNDFFKCTQCETQVQIPGIKPTRPSGPTRVSRA
jgi:hypothetical protein